MTEMSGRRPILVGVDGSAASVAALNWAIAEAARRDLPVLAVMVHMPQGQVMIGAVPYGVLTASGTVVEHADCVRRLAETVAEADAAGATVEQMVVSGGPGEELAKLSENAVMLVVGSHGHTRLAELVLGSVSAQCVRHATCPVVVIPRQVWDPVEEEVRHAGADEARH